MKLTYVLEDRAACSGVRPPPAHANRVLSQPAVPAAALVLAALGLLALLRMGPAASVLDVPDRVPTPAYLAAAAAAPAALQAGPAAPVVAASLDPTGPVELATIARWVQRAGAGVRIQAHDAPRRALVEQLAAATGTQLIGSTAVLDGTPAVTLGWQGQDLAALWAELLQGRANFAAQCEGRTCKLWLLDTPTSLDPAQRAAAAAPRVAEQFQPDPPGLFPAE